MNVRSMVVAAGLGLLVIAGCQSDKATDPVLPNVNGSQPDAAPAVSLAGPTLIHVKATYSFTASATHFFGTLTHVWTERFCNDAAGTTCSPWAGSGVSQSTYARSLDPDCSAAERNYQLHVTVTSGSQTASDTRQVWLCQAA
ncbi:MAG TPA: hypothetical protein VLT79_09950 [Gemmatimonadales bacterium]|nr:hypothetical protein [Gemmatimonadales bacterium]